MAAVPVRLRPIRDNESGVSDTQSMFYTNLFLVKFYVYVQAIHKNKNITTLYHEGEREHPNYELKVLRGTFLTVFAIKGVVRPGRQVLEVFVIERRAWLIDQVIHLWAHPIPAIPNLYESLGASFQKQLKHWINGSGCALVRNINEGHPDCYLPTAAIISHFFLQTPSRIHYGQYNYLERCLDYFRGTLDCTNFEVLMGYFSKEDLFVDLLR